MKSEHAALKAACSQLGIDGDQFVAVYEEHAAALARKKAAKAESKGK